MGFGSYDESEEERRQAASSTDEDVEVSPHDEGYDGESSFELEASEAMLDQLRAIKESKADAEEDT